jgi:hypothetical protein
MLSGTVNSFNEEDRILTGKKAEDFKYVGQIFGTYWIIEYEKKLLIIDQHAAHEKINYERSEFIHYDVPLYGIDDSIHCHIFFWNDNGMVRGDSMRIVFPDHLLAEEEFELMDTEADESTHFFITDNTIYIVEEFEATIDDVLRWLIRFDLDVCKPIYIREEE